MFRERIVIVVQMIEGELQVRPDHLPEDGDLGVVHWNLTFKNVSKDARVMDGVKPRPGP